MARDKLRIFYILSLLVLASLLVLFAQGVFTGLSAGSAEPVAEINRVDLFDENLGNYSKLSVLLFNNDSVSHNFSINIFFAEELERSLNVTVSSGYTYSYLIDVLPKEIPISKNKTTNSTLRIVKFIVYMDNKSEPFEQASFIFKNK